jgi:hypothetical protein
MFSLKVVLGGFFIIAGFCGIGIGTLGDTVVSSTIVLIDGLKISLGILVYSVISILGGAYLLST